MRIAELSSRSGTSIPTIKYYLREGLLPAGEATGRNQADYGDDPVATVLFNNMIAYITSSRFRPQKDALAPPRRAPRGGNGRAGTEAGVDAGIEVVGSTAAAGPAIEAAAASHDPQVAVAASGAEATPEPDEE